MIYTRLRCVMPGSTGHLVLLPSTSSFDIRKKESLPHKAAVALVETQQKKSCSSPSAVIQFIVSVCESKCFIARLYYLLSYALFPVSRIAEREDGKK